MVREKQAKNIQNGQKGQKWKKRKKREKFSAEFFTFLALFFGEKNPVFDPFFAPLFPIWPLHDKNIDKGSLI
jgi:hypothetical protein